ncbi:hypothetical protein BC834DRAFT_860482 [Gloeopeniophorella convolvens]|nr:hypothetical protein BC834DRAFT_860482 [Gloeopeniophorella convolvens]
MDALKASLNLNWTYKDAYDANATAISAILQQVRVFRHQLISQLSLGGVSLGTGTSGISAFGWPHDIDGGPSSQEFMLPHGADLWTLPSSHASSYSGVNDETPDSYALAHLSTESIPGGVDSVPLACASGNQTLAVYSDSLPLHMHLTAAKVACWYSHLQTIRAIANGSQEAALVLEDDVDMEIDTGKRLQALWGALPGEWDIVYLGHCWSDEAQLPPLRSISLRLTNGRLTSSALHPASAPKCTHAYALSRTGARRIVAHLRYPPFAYSRAIDQALAWLVESGRLRAFSVVPSVAVQRKVTGSDVMPGLGSAWRDGLYNGVLSGVIG